MRVKLEVAKGNTETIRWHCAMRQAALAALGMRICMLRELACSSCCTRWLTLQLS